ncbi:CULLIN-2 domain-containing protein [Favolaschia claudopus]|uniref:CULLIN-2 domain-containing protein n=1 Tax=Favolaschia claudopus TaxID=2862362 RepID=A0AAW0AVK5_9AGAR
MSSSTPTMIQEIWNTVIEPKIAQVLSGSARLTFAEHSTAYAAVYERHVRAGYGEDPTSIYLEFYNLVSKFFDEHTKRIAAGTPGNQNQEELVSYYDAELDRFSSGVKIVNRMLDYLNRFHDATSGRSREGTENCLTVRNLAFKLWNENVFDFLAPRLEGTNKVRIDDVRGGSCFTCGRSRFTRKFNFRCSARRSQ